MKDARPDQVQDGCPLDALTGSGLDFNDLLKYSSPPPAHLQVSSCKKKKKKKKETVEFGCTVPVSTHMASKITSISLI